MPSVSLAVCNATIFIFTKQPFSYESVRLVRYRLTQAIVAVHCWRSNGRQIRFISWRGWHHDISTGSHSL